MKQEALFSGRSQTGGNLGISDKKENEAKAADCIIVETFFGWQGMLWTVFANKYGWAENWFDGIFRFMVALKNVHIRWHPL